jgi:ABC-type proline/glycine betaine transport system substrate-binding protein
MMSSDDRQLERPTFDAVQLKDGSGYFVRVTWSDGFEQQINDFADEAEARQWITDNAPNWHEWASHRVQPKT